MATYRSRVLFAGLVACAVWLSAQETPAGAAKKLTLAEKEEFLRTANVVKHKEIGEGVTHPLRCTLEKDGFVHDAEFQKINEAKTQFESNRGTEMNFRDTYKFNIAAYELAKLLGIDDMVPPSVERKWGGNSGAMTWWVDDVLMTETERTRKAKVEPPDQDAWNRDMFVLRVFDQLIFNTDRNLGNLVIDKQWHMWMIDHTRAFRMRRDLPLAKNLVKCDRTLLAKMKALDKNTLKQVMGKNLSGMEIDGVLARRDAVVKFFDGEIKQKGEAAILYDRPARN